MAIGNGLAQSLRAQHAIPKQNDPSVPNMAQLPVGIWEIAGENGGGIGSNLWEAPASAWHGGPPPKDNEISQPVLLFGVYQRANAKVGCLEENFSDTGWRGARYGSSAGYAHELLRAYYPGHSMSDPPVDTELIFDPQKDIWKAHFRRGSFDGNVVLNRAPNRPSHDQDLCFSA
jgi:hypothetical protein